MLTYVSAIDDPKRFTFEAVGGAFWAHAKGETDISGRVSKIGDSSVRAVLYEAAHIILTRPMHGGALKSWAMRLAKRAGMKKAKVALARKLAVVLHRMWVSASTFDFEKLLEAKSRRGDDGRGQTGIGSVALRPRSLDWPAPSTFKPQQVAATSRPRTEARVRRPGDARGIDKSRPPYT